MDRVELYEADQLDYAAYASFQKEAYQDLLIRTKATDSHMTPDYYRWKYFAPAGKARIARIKEGNEVVSSSAMIPFWIRNKDVRAIGWHVLDVATLPKARKKGYFSQSLKKLFGTVSADEIVFAFPNASSLPSFANLGCRENVLLTTWINPAVFLSARSSPHVKEERRFTEEHDIFFKKANPQAPFLEHDAPYCNWRYIRHPNNTYVFFTYRRNGVCGGFAVARKARVMDRDLGLIMELWGENTHVKTALLRHAAHWAGTQGKRMMAMMNTSLSFLGGWGAFFFPVPSIFLPKRQILVLHAEGEKTKKLMDKKWLVQTGDWDVF
jgi:hypothetical protein